LIGSNLPEETDKTCAKGIKHSTVRTRENYVSSLYNVDKQDYATETIFVFNKQTTKIDSVTRRKKLLNNFYTKFSVQPDLVSLKPLKQNNTHV